MYELLCITIMFGQLQELDIIAKFVTNPTKMIHACTTIEI